jgi:hypothetical protein
METRIKSQKLGIGDFLGEGWQLYRVNFKNILLVILCVYIPINIIISLIPADSLLQEYGTRGLQLYNNLLKLPEFLIGTIATVGIAAIVEQSIKGKKLSWNDSLRFGLSKWITAIGTGLLGGVILLGLTLLFIIPGVIWSLYYSFWIYVVALRNVSGKSALDYSKSLVQGQWWRVFGIFFVFGIIGFVVGLAVIVPFNLISNNRFFDIIPNTVLDIVGAFFTVVTVVFFLNNDYRKKPVRVKKTAKPKITPQA